MSTATIDTASNMVVPGTRPSGITTSPEHHRDVQLVIDWTTPTPPCSPRLQEPTRLESPALDVQTQAVAIQVTTTTTTSTSTSTPPVKSTAAVEIAPAAADQSLVAPATMPLSQVMEVITRAQEGRITAAELKTAFASFTASQVSLTAELNQQTIKQLAPHGAAGMKKAQLVSRHLSHLSHHFVVRGDGCITHQPMRETFLQAVAREVSATTDADIAAYCAKRQEKQAAQDRAMNDPRSLSEFQTFIRARGESPLTDSQLERYDRLVAEENRRIQDEMIARAAQVTKVELGSTAMTLKEGFHTKRQEKIFIVQLSDRVGAEAFKDLTSKARRFGGNYSSWGARSEHGFQFRSKEHAESFMALQEGDQSNLDRTKERDEATRLAAADRLQETATRLTSAAEASLSADRKVNTARRAGQAAHAEKQARTSLQRADTLTKISEAISAGTLPTLAGVRHVTHVVLLEQVLQDAKWQHSRATNERWEEAQARGFTAGDIRHVRYPFPRLTFDALQDVAVVAKTTAGAKLDGNRIAKYVEAQMESRAKAGNTHDVIAVTNTHVIDALRDASRRIKGTDSWRGDRAREEVLDFDRMQAMGIIGRSHLRAALRDYLTIRGEMQKEDPIAAMERSLVGCTIPGFFPTPPALVDQLLNEAAIQPGHRILEPSAGKGDIADAIVERHEDATLVVCEVSFALREILTAKGHQVLGEDFLAVPAETAPFDRIVMNPPFEKSQDIAHVRAAYQLLAPGGRLVAIMSEGAFTRSDSAATDFRAWLSDREGRSEQNPQGSFAGDDAFRQTGVATRTVVVDRQAT